VFFTQIKILDVRSGSAAIGAEYNIYFGREKEMVYPNTPEQLSREYMVMMYRDADDAKHRLVEFPISKDSIHAVASRSLGISKVAAQTIGGSPGDARHRPVTREDALLTMRV